jgi:hypothetical protein
MTLRGRAMDGFFEVCVFVRTFKRLGIANGEFFLSHPNIKELLKYTGE